MAGDQGYLVIEQVVKDFGATGGAAAFRAVDNVSLRIAQGEIFALLGSSGCGKTSLLRLIGGQEQPASGSVKVAGEVVHELHLTLSPTLRRRGVQWTEEVPTGLRMDSYPGPLGQVLMNIVNNAVTHAFEQQSSPCMAVRAMSSI